eukprot:UN03273
MKLNVSRRITVVVELLYPPRLLFYLVTTFFSFRRELLPT